VVTYELTATPAAEQGTRVSGLHVGYVDTDMVKDVAAPKLDPEIVAVTAVDGIAAGDYEILVDEGSRQLQAGLAGGIPALYPGLP
jgi:NAD(P)-dependent dehydrogenase (short-subunit alcohol dehydrogenase family)